MEQGLVPHPAPALFRVANLGPGCGFRSPARESALCSGVSQSRHEDCIGGFQPVAFWTDDVFATAKTMKSKGVEFAVEPKKEP